MLMVDFARRCSWPLLWPCRRAAWRCIPWRRQGRWTNGGATPSRPPCRCRRGKLEIFALELDDVDHKATLGVLAGHAGHQAERGLEAPIDVGGCTVEGLCGQLGQSRVSSGLLFMATSDVKSLHAPATVMLGIRFAPRAGEPHLTGEVFMHVAAPRPCVASSPWLWRHLCLAAPVAAAPAVVLSDGGAIEAPGALLGMDVRPGGEAVLLVGEDGWAHRIDGLQPIEGPRRGVGTGRSVDINAVDWHPVAPPLCWWATRDC